MLLFASSLPLILAAVLLTSGIGKLRHPDDLGSWRDLGVPVALRKRWLLGLHPWGEIALAAALSILGGALGAIAACVALALMGAYTILVIRTVRTTNDASCACFGTRTTIGARTVVRNVWLTMLAGAVLAVIWATPLLGGAVATLLDPASGIEWLIPAAVVAITTFVIASPEQAAPTPKTAGSPTIVGAGAEPAASPDDELDYVRVRTPAVPVATADGATVNLRTLASRKPILLLAVSEICGACVPVIDSLGRYRMLLPEVDVRLLLRALPEQSSLTDTAEPQTLHDPHNYVSGSIADWPTPTAVLLGMDGMLAGGPEIGSIAIDSFVDDIYESLHGVRPGDQAPASAPSEQSATHTG